jgi:hypothetical protein
VVLFPAGSTWRWRVPAPLGGQIVLDHKPE